MNEPRYDLQAERVLNVSQEAAFDAYTSPALWSALGADSVCDLRVGAIGRLLVAHPTSHTEKRTISSISIGHGI